MKTRHIQKEVVHRNYCRVLCIGMYALHTSVTLTKVNRNASQHKSSVLVHVSCCSNKEENAHVHS